MPAAFSTRTDHLDGILFIDRLDKKQRKLAMKAIREAEWSGLPGPGDQGLPALHPADLLGSTPVRLVFAGTPAAALPTLRALAASRHSVAAVVTRPDAPAGRRRRMQPSPVAELAGELGLEILKPARPNEAWFLDRLRALAPDCCPVTAYGALLPQAALDIPAHGWVNLHFSVLPAWRGAAPVQHAVLRGDDITGATTFLIVKELDAGPGLRHAHRAGPPGRHQRRPA